MQKTKILFIGMRSLIVTIWLCTLSTFLSAQNRVTTLLPETNVAVIASGITSPDADMLRIGANDAGTEIARTVTKFNFKNLPQNAKINTATLRLYVSSKKDVTSFAKQNVSVLTTKTEWNANVRSRLSEPQFAWTDIANNRNTMGIAVVTSNTSVINLKLREPSSPVYATSYSLLDGNKMLSLAARSAENGQDNYFFSTKIAAAQTKFSQQPILVLRYEVDPYPQRSDWQQSFNNPQHTSYLNWYAEQDIVIAKLRKFDNADPYISGADPTGAIAIYKGSPIVFTQARSGTSSVYYVKQLDGSGKVIWAKGVNDVAKCWPLIDEKGRLYYFTASTLSILDLENNGEFVSAGDVTFNAKTISVITDGRIASIITTPAIGYDGTLYIVSGSYITALSAFPGLRIKWVYRYDANTERVGPVSLSPDESKAFFISTDEQQKTGRLVMLDNTDGSVISRSDYILGNYTNGNNKYIPAPVACNDSQVFVLNGFDNSSKLCLFNTNGRTGTIPVDDIIVSGAASVNTGISQPVLDGSGNAFFVYNNKLGRYDKTKTNHVDVMNDPNYALDNASILVTDASSHIFALDPYSSRKKVLGYKYSNNALKGNFQMDISDISFDGTTGGKDNYRKNLVLAPDGTLYTANINNLFAIRPAGTSADILALDRIKNNNVYHANKITIEGVTVEQSVNAVIYAENSIIIRKGFKVKTGARLVCKTKY